jgi:uncharacterized delta-60 repeat protein
MGVATFFSNGATIYATALLNSTVETADIQIGGATFSIGTGYNHNADALAIQDDGKFLVGGVYISYNGTSANRIIRLNDDGSIDSTFIYGIGFNTAVNFIEIQSDGKLLIGGDFTDYNGTAANRIIRLNADGTIDGTFVYGTGFFPTVNIIKVQSDGKIILGGSFITYNGTPANRIIRLDDDGTIDGTFVYGTGFNSVVYSFVIQSDGKIIIGGQFTTYTGTSANNIIKLNNDGTIDGTFVYGSGFSNPTFNYRIEAITVQSDGKILAGGTFTDYNGTAANRIIRLNADGTVDGTFVYGTGFDDTVQAITLQADGKILVGGIFTDYNGTAANRIIRLNADGTVDGTFVYGTGFPLGVQYISIQSDGKIICVGDFTAYNGEIANRIIRLNTNGSSDTIGS